MGFSLVWVKLSLRLELLKWGDSALSLGTWVSVQRHLWLSQPGGAIGIWREKPEMQFGTRECTGQPYSRESPPETPIMSGQRSSARDRPPLHSILCSSSDFHLLACFAVAAGGATIAAMISATQTTKIPNDSGEFHSLEPLPCPGTMITIQYLTQCNNKPMQ